MKKLYRVMVSAPVYVLANSIDEVEDIAKLAVKENEYQFFDYDIYPASLETIEYGYDDYIPYEGSIWGKEPHENKEDLSIKQLLMRERENKCFIESK